MGKKKNNQLVFLEKKSPWTHNENPIWLGSVLSVQRNLEKFKFPGKLEGDRRKQLLDLLSSAFSSSPLLDHPHVIRAESMTPLEKEFLVEHFLTSNSFLHTHSGEAFILDESSNFLATINMKDHIHLERIETEGKLEEAWESLVALEREIGKTINYAFSPTFGFLTSDPQQCGTAFFCQSFLQLTALSYTQKLDEVLEEFQEEDIQFTGLQGNPEELIGDLVVVRNPFAIGTTEANILSKVRSVSEKLLTNERHVRKDLAASGDPAMKDQISRAYAILSHSYQVDAIEALNALSLIKLGIDLGWVTGLSIATLNDLFFRSRRAHLLDNYPELPPQEEVPHIRAEFVHEAMKKVTLTFS